MSSIFLRFWGPNDDKIFNAMNQMIYYIERSVSHIKKSIQKEKGNVNLVTSLGYDVVPNHMLINTCI